jgi:hypothetical protein
MMTFFLILLLPLNLWASFYELSDEELNSDSEEVLLKKPEKYLRNESMIYDFNTDLGIKDQRRYTGLDRNKFSIAGHISAQYEHPLDILGAEISYLHRSTSYHQLWWGAQLFQHRTYFNTITQNRSPSASPNSEGSFSRPGSTKNSVSGLGLGAAYRFKFLLDFLHTEDVFEMVEVFVNGLQLNESYIDQTYRGYGLTTNYGIHKRSSTSFFYGIKFSYNVGRVTREAIANEARDDRSLALGWLSGAFEMGFFY